MSDLPEIKLDTQENLSRKNWNSFLKRYPSVPFFILTITIGLTVLGFAGYQLGLFSHNFDINNNSGTTTEKQATPAPTLLTNDSDYVMPKKESDRLDILLLGIRGADQNNQDVGALLTDTMIILSYSEKTGKTAMVSIPRDLYVKLSRDYEEKINAAYEVGLARGQGLEFSRKLISQISGVYIDQVIVVDFTSFTKIIDDIGGIDIYLDKPFTESTQWSYEFSLPAGENHLNGEQALYYARSRYSSTDFDRAARQQKIISAVKDKILSLNFLSEPSRVFQILSTLKKNIETTLNIWDLGTIIQLSRQLQKADTDISHQVLSTDNLLYDTKHNGAYILLPRGDNFSEIKILFQKIVQ